MHLTAEEAKELAEICGANAAPAKIVVEVQVRRREPPLAQAFLCFGALVALSWLAEKLDA